MTDDTLDLTPGECFTRIQSWLKSRGRGILLQKQAAMKEPSRNLALVDALLAVTNPTIDDMNFIFGELLANGLEGPFYEAIDDHGVELSDYAKHAVEKQQLTLPGPQMSASERRSPLFARFPWPPPREPAAS